jgi:hypothetical protein
MFAEEEPFYISCFLFTLVYTLLVVVHCQKIPKDIAGPGITFKKTLTVHNACGTLQIRPKVN